MPDGIVVLDGELRVIHCSDDASEMLQVPREIALGMPVKDLLSAADEGLERSPSLQSFLRILGHNTREPQEIELTLTQPQRRDLVAKAFPVSACTEEMNTALLFQDVTQSKDLERRRETFASVLYHELQDPITTIVGFSGLLLNQQISDPKQREWVEVIDRCSKHMVELCGLLKDARRLQYGQLDVKMEPLVLRDVLHRAMEMVRPSTTAHQMAVDIEPEKCEVMADPVRLSEVFINLLGNAVKYSPDGGEVVVSARPVPHSKRVVVEVRDQGIGIAPEEQERMFSAFQRVTRPETVETKGLGLGLYIAKGMVEAMGGEIWLDSELGKGSSFFFSLPMPACQQDSPATLKT